MFLFFVLFLLSGHSSLIGVLSGRILGRAFRIKICSLCSNGHDLNDHDCRLNFRGSAKAMEPDMAAQLVVHNKDLEDENVIIGTVVGDEDASTMCRIRRESAHVIAKESDMNHNTKSVSNKLWKLRLPKQTIDYLKKCFGCAIKKNGGDPEAVRKDLSNVVDHAFDKHEMCGEWCRFKEDPENYKHRGLPDGKGLHGTQLHSDLTQIFGTYANNAEKIAACSSTQLNESFNAIVASKAPKGRCYGRSESLVYRLDAAVSQKNTGTGYVVNVAKKLNVSPGKHTKQFREKKDVRREERAKKMRTAEFKRRRLFRKKNRNQSRNNAERREGITYSSGCALTEEIVSYKEASIIPAEDMVAIVFDLETTGFGARAEVVQIAAKYQNQEFNCYILPSNGIPAVVTEVTGLSVYEGQLILRDKDGRHPIETQPPLIACTAFITFLKNVSQNVILVAHKGVTFDSPQIVKAMHAIGLLETFGLVVKGFTDTLPVFKSSKELIPRIAEKKSFKLTDLAHDYLGPDSSEGAHNATVDVEILDNLLKRFAIEETELISRAVSFSSVANADRDRKERKTRIDDMAAIKGAVSAAMITKIAAAGLTLTQLERTFNINGENGITTLLGEDIGGKPRVSKNKTVLRKLCDALRTLSEERVLTTV